MTEPSCHTCGQSMEGLPDPYQKYCTNECRTIARSSTERLRKVKADRDKAKWLHEAD